MSEGSVLVDFVNMKVSGVDCLKATLVFPCEWQVLVARILVHDSAMLG